MDLCDLCTEITKWLETLNSDRGSQYMTWVMRASEKSAEEMCPFCKIWLSKVQRDWQWHYLMLRRFYLRIDFWCFESVPGDFPYYDNKDGHYSIRGRVTTIAIPQEYWGSLWYGSKIAWVGVTTWTDNSDASNETVFPLKTILSPRFEYLCSLTRDWLRSCESEFSGAQGVKLPTRLLMIQPASNIYEMPSVKLVESEGCTGTYCALSHCWGSSPEKGPLRTTSGNLQQHLVGIPFESLPKTFQDAVLFVRGIGILYVWIDSLCIVQDDEKDWHQEARQMGNIYRNASLVVLAADAKDASEGLYFREVPFVISKEREEGATGLADEGRRARPFNAALHSTREALCHDAGPLYKRAWAHQERYLAQRLAFFLEGRFALVCGENQRDDMDDGLDLFLYDEMSWIELLRAFTKKILTFETDRLHALRGIVDDMRATSQGHFYYQYGIREAEMTQDLLWRRDIPVSAGTRLELPTWAWAAISGAKVWCPIPQMLWAEESLQSVTKSLKITERGLLATTGYLTATLPMLHFCSLKNFGRRWEDGPEPEVNMIFGEGEILHVRNINSYTIWNDMDGENVLGIAVFDSGKTDMFARCYFLASSEKDERGNYSSQSQSCLYSSYKDVPKHDYFSNADIQSFGEYGDYQHLNDWVSETWLKGHDEEASQPKSSCVEPPDSDELERRFYRLRKTTTFVYWALLLKPVGDNKFERIGLAMLYPHGPSALGAKLTEIEII